ncbi:MAG: methyltransferase domain-containing protein [Rhodospirillales bacterium]|nr:methyltransferase domain-containing protein [Rhodospirillales bacterium]
MLPTLQLTESDNKYWSSIPRLTDWLVNRLPKDSRVLEIGPGAAPFPRTDIFADWHNWGTIPEDRLVICDLSAEKLPFKDKEFDFVYCRHVIEDMYNPFSLCREMSRVAKAGFLETPSPIAEVCRGVDGGSPAWRGYCHHRYFVWVHANKLRFLTKYPMVEYLRFEDEQKILGIMKQGPAFWNTYHLWDGEIDVEYTQHETDYSILTDYGSVISKAMDESIAATQQFIDMVESQIVANPSP